MVKLTKIYTRTGDSGTTGLGTGQRVKKSDLRVEAYGTVDETNAVLGVVLLHIEDGHQELRKDLSSIQHDLFDLGADLCTPIRSDEDPAMVLRVMGNRVNDLEGMIDRYNADLAPLTSFVLPGGTQAAAHLHVARTVSRRAERLVCDLLEKEPAETNPDTVRYLNRLSDLFFVCARWVNRQGPGDVLWVPGKNRV